MVTLLKVHVQWRRLYPHPFFKARWLYLTDHELHYLLRNKDPFSGSKLIIWSHTLEFFHAVLYWFMNLEFVCSLMDCDLGGGHINLTFGENLQKFSVSQASPQLNIEVWDKDYFTHADFIVGEGNSNTILSLFIQIKRIGKASSVSIPWISSHRISTDRPSSSVSLLRHVSFDRRWFGHNKHKDEPCIR